MLTSHEAWPYEGKEMVGSGVWGPAQPLQDVTVHTSPITISFT